MTPSTRPNSDHTRRPISNMRTSRIKTAFIRIALDYGAVLVVFGKGFLLVPMYLRHISLGAYGAWLAAGSILAVMGLVEGGFTLIFAQRLSLSAGAGDKRSFANDVVSGSILLGAMALAVTMLAFGTGGHVARVAGVSDRDSAEVARAIRAGGFALGLTFIQTIFVSIWDSWQLPHVGGVARILGQLTEMCAAVLYLRFGLGLASLPLAAATGTILVCLSTGLLMPSEWSKREIPSGIVSLRRTTAMASACLPTFFSKTASVVVNNNEPLLAATLVSTESAAVIALTDRAYKLLQMIVNVGASSAYFALCHLRGEHKDDSPHVSNAISRLLQVGTVVISCLFGIAIASNEAFVSLWVGAANFGGRPLSVALGLSAGVAVRTNLSGLMLTAAGGARSAAYCQSVEVLLRLPLLLFLLPRLGLIGIPVATLASTALMLAPSYSFYLSRHVKWLKRIDFTDVLYWLAPSAALLLIGTFAGLVVGPPRGWTSFVAQAIVCSGLMAVFLAVWLALAISRADREDFKRFLRTSVRRVRRW